MKFKKTKKSKGMRGTRYHGWAAKKHKGAGNKGGMGMSGSGKRSDHKKTWVIRNRYPYLGKQGFTSRKTIRDLRNVLNVRDIQEKYKPGEVNLEKYKILGDGEITGKFTVKAKSFSKSAKEKIEKAGGKIIVFKKEGKNKNDGKNIEK